MRKKSEYLHCSNQKKSQHKPARILKQSGRVLLICIVSLAVIVFASLNKPIQRDASARVFDDILWHLKSVPRYFGGTQTGGEPVPIDINGSRLYYATQQSTHSTTDILDYYEELYIIDPEMIKTLPLFESDKARLAFEDNIDEFTRKGKLKNTVRVETETFGAFAVLDNIRGTWEQGPLENFSSFIKAAQQMLQKGDVSELGVPKAVVVFRERPQSAATITRIWPDDHFNFKSFMPQPDGDWPGEDISAVPRYPDSQRIISFSVPNSPGENRINVYRSRDRLLGTILYYRSELPANGWKTSPIIDNVIEKKGTGRKTMFFTKAHEACWVSLHERDEYVYHTVVYRSKARGN